MPILIEPSLDAPLTQGDILKGIALFATDANWGEQGGVPSKVKSPLCMVISRPCAARHKPQVVVAAIERLLDAPPKEVNTLEKVRVYLEGIRDGLGSPDRFYLGQQIPHYSEEGRFFAGLDALYTVKLPPEQESVRRLSAHRIATLADDFRRDLHRRLFSSFAALGFDDHGWYPDSDLAWIVAVGEQEVSSIETQIRQKQAEIAKNEAAGNRDRNGPLEGEVQKLRAKVEEIQEQVTQYREEQGKRRSSR